MTAQQLAAANLERLTPEEVIASPAAREPSRALIAAILAQAVKDVRHGDVGARFWLLTDDAGEHCDAIGLSHTDVIEWVMGGCLRFARRFAKSKVHVGG